jgi:hypothetical protein
LLRGFALGDVQGIKTGCGQVMGEGKNYRIDCVFEGQVKGMLPDGAPPGLNKYFL